MKPRAIIFDLFGTLVPTYESQEIDQKIAHTLGVSKEKYYRALADSAEQRYRGMFPTVKAMFEHICVLLNRPTSELILEQVTVYRLEATRKNLEPRENAIRILERLKSSGVKLGLLSDSSPDVPTLYSETPFAKLIDNAVFSCVVQRRKPDADIYRLICRELGVVPKRCVYVGDGGSNELFGAQSLGIRSILLHVPMGEAIQSEAKIWKGEAITSLEELQNLTNHSR